MQIGKKVGSVTGSAGIMAWNGSFQIQVLLPK